MNILIIGNSHVGALKLAWNDIKSDYQETEIVFCAAPGNYLGDILINDGYISAPIEKKIGQMIKHISGSNNIEILTFDVFIFYGLGYTFKPTEEYFLSASFLKDVIFNRFQKSLNYNLLTKIRKYAKLNSDFICLHTPLISNEIFKPEMSIASSYEKIINSIHSFFPSEKISFFIQPESTRINDWFTKTEFTKNSLGLAINTPDHLAKPHSDDDVIHMNKKFGDIYIRSLINSLKSLI